MSKISNCLENNLSKIKNSIMSHGIRADVSNPSGLYINILNTIITKLDIKDVNSLLTEMINNTSDDINNLMYEVNVILLKNKRLQGVITEGNTAAFISAAAAQLKKELDEKTNTKSSLQSDTDLESNTSQSSDISSEGGETSTNLDESLDTKENISEPINLTNSLGTNNISKITSHYLGDNLISKPHLMFNLFKELVANNWMPSDINASLEENFVSEDVVSKIKEDAKKHIIKYYTTYADAILNGNSKFNDSTDTKMIIVDSIDRIPLSSIPITEDIGGERIDMIYEVNTGISIGNESAPSIKISLHESSDIATKDDITFIVVENRNGSNLSIAERDTILIQYLSTRYDLDLNGITSNSKLIEGEKAPSINKDSANTYHNNKAITSAYFSNIILNETNAFIKAFAEELNSTYKTFKRIGAVENDVLGIKGSSRVLNLGIITTRFLKKDTTITSITAKLSGLLGAYNKNNYDSSIARILDKDGAIKSIEGSKLLSYIENNVTKTGILLNLKEGIDILFVYNSESRKWEIPIKHDGVISYLNNDSQLNNLQYIPNKDLLDDIKDVLHNLNTYASDTEDSTKSYNKFKTDLDSEITQLSAEEIDSIISSFNTSNALISPVEKITLSQANSEEKYLTMKDFISVIGVLQEMPENNTELEEFFEKEIKKDTREAAIIRSLYFKYFKIGSYKISAIDSLTGLMTVTEHSSMTDKYLNTDSLLAFDAVNSMESRLSSIVRDDKISMKNETVLETRVGEANDLDSVITAINTSGMVQEKSSSKYVYDDYRDVKKKFKLVKSGKKVLINFYSSGKKSYNSPTVSLNFNDGVFIGVQGIDPLTLSVIQEIGNKVLALPPKILTKEFYGTMLKLANNDVAIVNNFYASIIAIRLANTMNTASKEYTFDGIGMISTGGSVEYKYEDNNVNSETRELLNDTLKELSILNSSTIVQGVNPSERHEAIQFSNLAKSKKQIIKSVLAKVASLKSSYLFKNSGFIDGEIIKILSNGASKLGIGDNVKGISNKDLTAKDQLAFQMSIFMQRSGINFKSPNIQTGPMSDRSQIQMFKLMMSSGMSMIPMTNSLKLDEHVLRERFMAVQGRSFSGLQNHIVLNWKEVLNKMQSGEIKLDKVNDSVLTSLNIESITSMRDVYNTLKMLQIDYNEALHKTGLTENITLFKGANGEVSLNHSTMQLVEIMTTSRSDAEANSDKELEYNADLKNFYIDMYLNDFNSYIEDVGFELSNKDYKIVLSKFEYISNNFHTDYEKYEEATKVAKKMFFYNSSMFEHELMQFEMGTLFQYTTKEQSKLENIFVAAKASIAGGGDSTRVNSSIPKKINKVVLSNGKALADTTYDELLDVKDRNYWRYVKNILNSKITPADKVKLLQYHDIFTQLTPMYVDRVKRNQGPGTAGTSFVLAKPGKAGHLLPKKSKTVTFENLKKAIRTLTNDERLLDILDGSEYVSTNYMIKHNNSLGNTFSNYASKGGAVKTVNVSQSDEGIASYEKLAGFNSFTNEMLQYGTPEHNRLNKFMMDTEKFDSYDAEYEGMYLPENPQEITKNYKTLIVNTSSNLNLHNFKKHGEYLGQVQVTYVNKKTGEEITTEMNSRYLMHALNIQEIDPSSITKIATTRVFISKELINSKWDLYNYYGGIQGNIDAYNKMKTQEDKNDFDKRYPFGWVDYKVGYIMGNFSGGDMSYNIRNAEIDKILSSTAAKTGKSKVNPSDVIYDRNYNTANIEIGEISNEHLLSILDADHDSSVDSALNISKDQEDVNIAMMTQVMSAIISEGKTVEYAKQLNSAISILSNEQLRLLELEISSFESSKTSVDGDSANRQYAAALLRRNLETRKEPGNTEDFLGSSKEDAAGIAFDIKMLLPLLRTSINSEFSGRGIKLRFPGVQTVLSPAYGIIKTYNFNGSKLLRSSLLGKSDINSIIKEDIAGEYEVYSELPPLQDIKWNLRTISDINSLDTDHSPSDYIYEKIYLNDGKRFKLKAHKVSGILSSMRKSIEFKNSIIHNINIGSFVSPWSIEDSTTSGSELGWYKYFKDGINLYDTEFYLSYLASGEMPKILSSLSSIDEKISEFKKYNLEDSRGESFLGIPKGLLTQYLLDTEETGLYVFGENYNTLELASVLGDNVHSKTIEYFSNNPESIDKFFTWLESFKGSEQQLSSRLRTQLRHELETGNWEMSEAEFFMSPSHQFTYLLKHGTQPSDINGHQEQPDITKLMSITTININGNIVKLFTDEEKLLLETTYPQPINSKLLTRIQDSADTCPLCLKYLNNRGKDSHVSADILFEAKVLIDGKFKQLLTDVEIENIKSADLYDKINNQENCVYCETYLKLRDERQTNAVNHFNTVTSEIINELETKIRKKGKLSNKEINTVKKRSPLILLYVYRKNKNLNSIIENLLSDGAVIGDSYTYDLLLKLKNLNHKSLKIAEITTSFKGFKNSWASILANNFNKSLTFITARIPAQGPQFTTSGKVKAFVYSTRNSIYAPSELFLLNGGDYDIDKQNNINWNANGLGKIIPFKLKFDGALDIAHYINNNRESNQLLKNKLESDVSLNQDLISKLLLDKDISDVEHLSNVTQNYILDRVIKTIGHSSNALESAVVTALDKLGEMKNLLSLYNFSEIEEKELNLETILETDDDGKQHKRYKPSKALATALAKRRLAIPFSPTTKLFYEKMNMDGKMGIAMFASALKAYYAAYYATVINEGAVDFENELNKQIFTDIKSIIGSINQKTGERGSPNSSESLSKNLLRTDAKKFIKYTTIYKTKISDTKFEHPSFVWKDRKTGLYKSQVISGLANASHTLPNLIPSKTKKKIYGALHYTQSKLAFKSLMQANSYEEEIDILTEFVDQFEAFKDFNSENQVWEDLSELLTAATDNAKELILGIIGSNNDTANIIASMVMVGIDLRDALSLINDPIIVSVINARGNQNSITGRVKTDLATSLTGLLKKAKYSKVLTAEEIQVLKSNIIKELNNTYGEENVTNDMVLAETESQLNLHRDYNPPKQMLFFEKGAREFSLLSRILKINTGMVNSEIDTFNYLMMVESAIGRFIPADGDTKAKGGLDLFLDEGSSDEMWSMINSAEKNKTFINIPYIIYKNKHFFEYLRTFKKANEMVSSLSYTTNILYSNLKPDLIENHIYKSNFKYNEFNDFILVIQDLAIDSYFSKFGTKIIREGAGIYDLTLLEDRESFIQDVPTIVENAMNADPSLSNNTALKHIINPRLVSDVSNNSTIRLLTGVNSHVLNSGEVAGLKVAMQALKITNPKIYSLLFNYSLLIDRAGLSNNSIAQLFSKEDFESYIQHVRDLKGTNEINEKFSQMNPLVKQVAISMYRKDMSTMSGINNATLFYKKNKLINIEESYDTDEDYGFSVDPDQIQEESISDYDDADQGSNRQNAILKISNKYNTDNISELYDSDKYYIPEVLTSVTNGLTYKVLSGNILVKGSTRKFTKFVPVTKMISNKISGIVYEDTISDDSKTNIKAVGYDYGYSVKLHGKQDARIISRFEKSDNYVVISPNKTIAGEYIFELVNKQVLEESNPRLLLLGDAILLRKDGYNITKEASIYYIKSTGEVKTEFSMDTAVLNYNIYNTKIIESDNKLLPDHRTSNEVINAKIKNKSKVDLDSSLTDVVEKSDKILNIVLKNIAANLTSVYSVDFDSKIRELLNNTNYIELDDISASVLQLQDSIFESKDLMYSFLRLPYEEKVQFVIKEMSRDLNIENKIIKFNRIKKQGHFSNTEVQSANSFFNSIKMLESKSLLSTDIEFLTKNNIDRNSVNVNLYLNILNKTGISDTAYLQSIGAKVLLKKSLDKTKLVLNTSKIIKDKIKHELTPVLPPIPENISKIKKVLNNKVITKLGSFLNKRFKDATIEVLSLAEIKIKYPEIDIKNNTKAVVKSKNNTIIMVKGRATLDTMLHEMAHIYLAELRNKNVDLYHSILDNMSNTEEFLKTKELYADIEGYNNIDILEETFVLKLQQLLAPSFINQVKSETDLKLNTILTNENGDSLGNVLDSFKTLFGDFLGKDITDLTISMDDSVHSIIMKIGADMIFGENSALNSMSKDDRLDLKKFLKMLGVTKTEAISILRENNYIIKTCK